MYRQANGQATVAYHLLLDEVCCNETSVPGNDEHRNRRLHTLIGHDEKCDQD